MPIQSEQQALDALEQITAELAKPRAAGLPDLGKICETYKKIKPFLEGVLWLIEKVPVVGKKIADAVRFLISVADLACPVRS